jgi:hypothetical protein
MSEFLRLLAHLHRGGQFGYIWVLPDKRSYWAPAGELPRPPAGAFNVYFGVHPTVQIPPVNGRGERVPPEHVRAQIPYIAAVNCLFAEFDAVQFLNDKDRIMGHIGGLAQRPSVVVDSGGGYHAYWLLRETFYLDSPEARERAIRIQRAWVEHVKGDPGARDLARVLRLPGTLNHKYKPARPVRVARSRFDRLYDLGDLARACRAGRPRPRPPSRSHEGAAGPAGDGAEEPGALPAAVPPSEEAIADARALLARLAKWRCDEYEAWVEVGMALSELGPAGLQLWDAWSRGSSKHHERDCEEKWLTFRPGEGLTLRSLAFWASEDSPLPPLPRSEPVAEGRRNLRWDGRKGERAYLQGKEVRYAVIPEGRVWRVKATAGPGRRGVDLLVPRTLSVLPGAPSDGDAAGPQLELVGESAREIAVALNANMEQVRRELAEIPDQLAAHPPPGEAPPPSDPKSLADFAPWVAGRLSGRGSREDKSEVGRAVAAWLLRERRLLSDLDTGGPYLLADDAQCLSLTEGTLPLEATLAQAGLNASEHAFAWMLADLKVAAHRDGRAVRLSRFIAADPERATVHLSCGPAGFVAAAPGADLAYRRNGTGDVIFAGEATLPEWDPTAEPVDPYMLAAFRPRLVAPPEASAYTPDVQTRLASVWLVALVAGIRPLPMLALIGNKGGGKTTLGRSIQQLLMGERGGLTPLSGDLRDFWTLIQGRPVAGFDNVDGAVPPWFIDALANAVTGGRVQKRELYTDDTLRDRDILAAIVVTSRTAPFARPDVTERALPLFTAEFEDGMRRPDSELDREVAEERSGMLVYLLRRACQVLERQQEAPLDLPARFLDFARLVWAWHAVAERPEEAQPVLAAWRAAQALAIGDADPLLAAIAEYAPPEGHQQVTASELIRRLNHAGAELPYLGGGQRIANHLRELRSMLSQAGWQLDEKRVGDRTYFSILRRRPAGEQS